MYSEYAIFSWVSLSFSTCNYHTLFCGMLTAMLRRFRKTKPLKPHDWGIDKSLDKEGGNVNYLFIIKSQWDNCSQPPPCLLPMFSAITGSGEVSGRTICSLFIANECVRFCVIYIISNKYLLNLSPSNGKVSIPRKSNYHKPYQYFFFSFYYIWFKCIELILSKAI